MMSFSVVGMYNKKQGILAPYIAPDCVYFIPTGNALRATLRVSRSEKLARRRAASLARCLGSAERISILRLSI